MSILLVILIVILDQVTKYVAKTYLIGNTVTIIKNLLYFTYVENKGAAFGIFQNARTFFIIITLIVLVGILYFIKKYETKLDKLEKISISMIFSGAIGNFIDRLLSGYVVDFIGIVLPFNYKFPIFNIADIAVTFGALILIIKVLFFDNKEESK